MATGFGCVGAEPTGVNALEFRLVAVDGDGGEKSVFEAGQRIGITAKLINHSREDLIHATGAKNETVIFQSWKARIGTT